VSVLLGRPDDRLSLPRAVDALRDAARRAGRPSWLWLAGLFYPSLNLNVDLLRGILALVQEVTGIEVPLAGEMGRFITLFAPGIPGVNLGARGGHRFELVLGLLPILLLSYRLIVGLAKVSDPLHVGSVALMEPVSQSGRQAERAVPLRRVWREGNGLALMGLGLWGTLLLLLFFATLVLIGPLVALLKMLDLARFSALFAGLLLPVLVLVLAYAAVLMVLNQLALHSLAHNRRGVASALTHAWRLVRTSPLGALRATLVDLVLFLSVLVVDAVFVRNFAGDSPLSVALELVLFGFAGVTRAGYWARAYRALGGLSSSDNVPGL
jgi:hypothetical protein